MPNEVEILIVEDSATQAEQLKLILEQHGYVLRHARDGKEALGLMRVRKPTLLISDVNMPEMDGYQLCRRIRADERLADLPVILLTALSDPEDVVRGLECGADNFLTKPYDENYLVSRIRYILSNRHLREYERTRISLEIFFAGQKHQITADRLQILNLLLSTYETAVLKNHELSRAQEALRQLNEQLEAKVRERTAALEAEMAERKRAEEERLRLHREIQLLLASTGEGIYGTDAEGRCTFMNRAGAELIGYTPEAVMGRELHTLIHHHRPDGSAYPADDCPIHRAARTGQPASGDAEVFWRRDGTSFPIHYSSHPILEAGAIRGAVVVFADITEKKRLEAESLRNQRLESIGTLAGGIAHDLNNVLAPVLMSLQILRMKYTAPDDERLLSTIEASAARGADMVKQVLTFARGVQGERVAVQLVHLIKEVAKILKQTFPKSIQVRTALQDGLWALTADATQLHQVLMNLCVNARDAMPHGGTLTLSATNLLVDDPFASMHPHLKPGPHVELKIADTGTGIPPEIKARIFEPFFTTKETGKGTGLGLSTARSIVKNHAGDITCYSEVGQGTEFKIYLPALRSAATEAAAAEMRALPTGSGELILVADDEAAILNIAKQTLEMFGYKVLTASDGAEAIASCAQHTGKIRVLVTDMGMPIMDGPATIRAVRRIDPRIKIVAASGLGSGVKVTDPEQLQVEAFLPKPYTAELLVKTVYEVLRGEVPAQRPSGAME
ncbi:MAG: response regulator [Verrucomicrobia bacterium]|nr:response regulator [Verrucomicrobiota bacterium]